MWNKAFGSFLGFSTAKPPTHIGKFPVPFPSRDIALSAGTEEH
jgi:hypothetical protein